MLLFILPLLVWNKSHALSIDDIYLRLRDTQIVQGSYTQTKHSESKDNPIIATGNIVIVRDVGILMKNISPVPFARTITKNGILLWRNKSGKLKSSKSSSTLSGLISNLLLAIISGNTTYLENNFSTSISEKSNDRSWEMTVLPIHQKVRRRIHNIELAGTMYLNSITVSAKDNYVIELKFIDLKEVLQIAETDCKYFVGSLPSPYANCR